MERFKNLLHEEPRSTERRLRVPKRRPSQLKFPPHTEESLEEEMRVRGKQQGISSAVENIVDVIGAEYENDREMGGLINDFNMLRPEMRKTIVWQLKNEMRAGRFQEEDGGNAVDKEKLFERARVLVDKELGPEEHGEEARYEKLEQNNGGEPEEFAEETDKELGIEQQMSDSLLQQPKREKVSSAFKKEERIKSDAQRGGEKRKSQRELPKSVKTRRRFRKLKTALEKHS